MAASDLVKEETDKADFPTYEDVIALITVESRFNHKARSGPCIGLMQVCPNRKISLKSIKSPQGNIKAGCELLREYKESLGSTKAAIIAYNVGIGNYLQGKRNKFIYWKLYNKHLSKYNELKQGESP